MPVDSAILMSDLETEYGLDYFLMTLDAALKLYYYNIRLLSYVIDMLLELMP